MPLPQTPQARDRWEIVDTGVGDFDSGLCQGDLSVNEVVHCVNGAEEGRLKDKLVAAKAGI